MAGSARSSVRSAYVAETTPGTIVSTPGFTTLHQPFELRAVPQAVHGNSLVAGGARSGHGVTGIPVSGQWRGPLVYGVMDDFFASLLQGAWSSDVLTDGKAFATNTVENTIPAGVGGTNTMLRYRGVDIVSGTLALQRRAIAQLTLKATGMGSDDQTTTAITGATYTDPTEFDPMTSGLDVGTITLAGYSPLDCFESMDIEFAFDNRDPQDRIDSNDLCGITRGDFQPVITANMYVEANFATLYSVPRARHSAFKVTVPLGSVTGEKYTLEFEACYFADAGPDLGGDLMQRVEIHPAYSTAQSCVLTMTRAVA